MALRKGDNPSLQEIIDSYNKQLFDYHARAAKSSAPEQEQKAVPVQKEVSQAQTPTYFAGQEPLRELSEQFLTQLRKMPRPVPQENPTDKNESFAASTQLSEKEAGRAEYLQGIKDLQQGLMDLAQGEKDLREGIEAYEQGIRERDRWQAQAVSAAPMEYDQRYNSDPNRKAVQDSPQTPSAQTGYGRLRINTSAARQAMPIEGAYVQIKKRTEKGEELVAAAVTDPLGLTPFFELPVALSQNGGLTAPYAEYTVNASAPGFKPIVGLVAQVFAGISGTLPVFLVPLSEEERL